MKYNQLKSIIKAILLENSAEISDKEKLDNILSVYRSSSETGSTLRNIAIDKRLFNIEFAKDLYEKNKNSIDRMFKGATKVKYLGSGNYGDAFDLGNTVLKIEIDMPASQFDSATRSKIATSSIFSKIKKNQKLGKYFPMIYDKSHFTYHQQKFNWIIMEKFETIDGTEKYELDELLDTITDKILQNGNVTIKDLQKIENYNYDDQETILSLGSELRLKQNWFKDLVKGIYELYKTYGLSDFHAGNIGIRRSGAEGSFVFFD